MPRLGEGGVPAAPRNVALFAAEATAVELNAPTSRAVLRLSAPRVPAEPVAGLKCVVDTNQQQSNIAFKKIKASRVVEELQEKAATSPNC